MPRQRRRRGSRHRVTDLPYAGRRRGISIAQQRGAGRPRPDRRARAHRQGHRHRPSRSGGPAVNPATYTGSSRRSPSLRPAARGADEGLGPGPVLLQREGRACESCEGDGLVKIGMHFCPTSTFPASLQGPPLQPGDDGGPLQGPEHRTRCWTSPWRTRWSSSARRAGSGRARAPQRRRPGLPAPRPVGDDACRWGGAARQARHRARQAGHGRTLYILDEPTTGLHSRTYGCCSTCFTAWWTKGNSVLVIEHNLDVIKTRTGSSISDRRAERRAGRGWRKGRRRRSFG